MAVDGMTAQCDKRETASKGLTPADRAGWRAQPTTDGNPSGSEERLKRTNFAVQQSRESGQQSPAETETLAKKSASSFESDEFYRQA